MANIDPPYGPPPPPLSQRLHNAMAVEMAPIYGSGNGLLIGIRIEGRTAPFPAEPLPQGYQPSNLAELVSTTAPDLIKQTVDELGHSQTIHSGHSVALVPEEMKWLGGQTLSAEVLCGAIQHMIRLELTRFAQRIEQCYVLTPREGGAVHEAESRRTEVGAADSQRSDDGSRLEEASAVNPGDSD